MDHQAWNKVQEYLGTKFSDPDFYKNSPGIPMTEIVDQLHHLAAEDKFLPRAVAKARAFALVCSNVQIRLSECDLFPGLASCRNRVIENTHITPWHQEILEKHFTPAEFKIFESCYLSNTVKVIPDFDHSVPDWDDILALGFNGLLNRALACEEKYLAGDNTAEGRAYFTAIRIEYRAALSLLERLIAEANAQKLDMQSTALRNLRNGSAGTFYEALLQIWLYFQLAEYIDVFQARSFGNLDRILYPYYCRDIESGEYTGEDIRLFVRNFMYQSAAIRHKVGHPFYFGGTDADGSSAINELSYLILEEYDKMGIFDPKLQIKVSESTPEKFVKYALDMIRKGRNSIVFVGEPCIIRTMLKHGYSLREAQTADIKGCYEYCVCGETVETAPVTINVPKILGLALRNGIEILSGDRQGIETGEAEEFTSFFRLYRAFIRQLFFQLERSVEWGDRIETYLDRINPSPMLSAVFRSSLACARDGYARGARYNNSNIWLCATATAADSLMMIKKYVYEKKLFSLPQMVDILDRNFEGFENIRQILLNDPEKYGNNLDRPDRIATHFTAMVARKFDGRKNKRGGFYTVALHASNRFSQWAGHTEATPDGRRQGDELSKNMSPTQGNARQGVTSVIASVLKFDSARFMADLPVDIMLHPEEVKGENGLEAMYMLVMTFIKNYGHAIHFNVMDADRLREAQKYPEKYRDLQVRICGWNELWNSISRNEQDAYIRQADKL